MLNEMAENEYSWTEEKTEIVSLRLSKDKCLINKSIIHLLPHYESYVQNKSYHSLKTHAHKNKVQ